MSKMIIATAALFVAGTISAQSFYLPSNTPTTGTCNVIPFGTVRTSATWVNQKYQCLTTQSELGNKQAGTICDIAFAPCGTGSGMQHFDTLEIVLAQTNATILSTTFSANLVANVKTVLKATNYDWHVDGGKFNRIGFDTSYNYIAALGTNLVIQMTMTGNHKTGGHGTGFHRSNTHQRMYAFRWTGTPPATGSAASSIAALKWEVQFGQADLRTFGVGCTGSNGVPTLSLIGTGQLNTAVGVSVANCVNTAPVLHVFGVTRFEPRIDLAIIQAPGCFLYETTDVVIGGVANSSGVYSWQANIPNNRNLVCLRIYTQVFPADAAANNWGRTASNYGRILIGN